MAWPAFKTRFKTVLEILSSPAGPVRDRMISGKSASLAGSLSKTNPRSALGKISNSELKIRSSTSRKDQGPAQFLADQPQCAKLGLGLDQREMAIALIQDVDCRVNRRLLVVSLLDLHHTAVEGELQLADLQQARRH